MYPALAVLEALESEDAQVLWGGSLDGMEAELVNRENIPFTGIPAAGVHGVSLRALPGNLIQILRGWWEARKVIRQFKPDFDRTGFCFKGGVHVCHLACECLTWEIRQGHRGLLPQFHERNFIFIHIRQNPHR